MQLYALDITGQLTSARQALKHQDYQCLECEQMVRLRGGPYRQPHFYHLEPTPFCRQHQKGPIHLQLQSYFVQCLPAGDCVLEQRFPSINRIADVAWLSQKIIFEIQYSAISAQEVMQRNQDYQKIGWQVVWILHDHRYNQRRLSAAEMVLRSSPHFFSNMNRMGQGIIYDQFDVCTHGVRQERMAPLPIDITQPYPVLEDNSYPLQLLTQRAKQWKLFFTGDLMHLFLDAPLTAYLQQAQEKEKKEDEVVVFSFWQQIWQSLKMPYQVVLRFLLERACR